MSKYFVMLNGQKGPVAQIWHNEPPTNGNGKPIHEPFFIHKLTSEEETLTLDDLILKFKDKINAI